MAFAENLRRLRHQRFLSQNELAKTAGIGLATVQRLEAGLTTPHPRTVRQLAEALGVDPLELGTPEEVLQQKKAAA